MTEQTLNDRYALESKAGEGGMAVTYRARDLLLNRTVAIKIMREQFTSDPQFVERFRREAQAAARLSHENIAGVYDTGRANGNYYIVMEYVEGIDLKQRLRREGMLQVPTALDIAVQISAALEAAHSGGLVHRDIKPHNILQNKDGKVKVTDFGIAKIVSETEDTGVIIGSVHYISPEQARGEATTPASDLYALGAVMFEMLTGRTVFEGENAMALAHKQIYEAPPHPRSLRPEIPAAVEAVVLRCLEKDPRMRYQSAAELRAVLLKLLNQMTQEATVVIPGPTPGMDATMVYRKPISEKGPGYAPNGTRRVFPIPAAKRRQCYRLGHRRAVPAAGWRGELFCLHHHQTTGPYSNTRYERFRWYDRARFNRLRCERSDGTVEKTRSGGDGESRKQPVDRSRESLSSGSHRGNEYRRKNPGRLLDQRWAGDLYHARCRRHVARCRQAGDSQCRLSRRPAVCREQRRFR